jgi:hypothetical protein
MSDRVTATELKEFEGHVMEIRAALRAHPNLEEFGLDRVLGTSLFLVAEVRRLRSLIRRTYPLVDERQEGDQAELVTELRDEILAQRAASEETPAPGSLRSPAARDPEA